MLAISMILASTVASSSAWASSGCSAIVAGVGFGLLSSADVCELSVPATCCADPGTTSLVVGGELVLLSAVTPTVSQVSSYHWSTGSEEGISCGNTRFNCQSIVLIGKYSTTFAVPTLCGLLGGAGMVASRLASFSTMSGMLGRPGRLNIDRS
jgi:hypothetical protein